ncbi:MAG TPA: hypothetical protein VNK41_00745 [Vicinamibacterales bacterium]|nr:hypothetical protein [Vicinamibacterales bacterium]
MGATRSGHRLTPALEWLVAAAFLAATLVVVSLIVRELRTSPAPASAPVMAAMPAALPAAVPARAISVPVLLLVDGRQVKVGDTVEQVAATLGRAAETGTQVVDRGAVGERLTRFYEIDGTKFLLVFEPFERNGDLRVAAIYLQ